MKKQLLSLIIIANIVSCGQTSSNTTTTTVVATVDTIQSAGDDMQEEEDEGGVEPQRGKHIELDSAMYAQLRWANPLMDRYTKLADNKEIKLALKDNDTTLSWVWDQIMDTDTATYIVFNVGHTVTDEDGSSPRYTNFQWVYLDTVARQIYEYDLPKDELVKWDK
jgi:hypothetical protein